MPPYDPGPQLPVHSPYSSELGRTHDDVDESTTTGTTASPGLSTLYCTPCCPRSRSQSYSLPPSPPLTNPHLKRAIPLPCFHEVCHHHIEHHVAPADDRSSMEDEHAPSKSSTTSPGVNAASALLSPPYSPVRQRLQLLSLDELDESESLGSSPQPGAPLEPSSALNEPEWRDDVDDQERSESRGPGMFAEDSDNWDEPLFLSHPPPSALDESEGLDLTLYGPSYSIAEEPSQERFDVPSSPSFRSSSLPDLDDPTEDKSGNALLDPSNFDVFNNGWDTVVSDSTQNASAQKQQSVEDDVEFNTLDEFAFGEPEISLPPESPSRRSVVNLPGSEFDDDEPGRNLPPRPSSPVNLPDLSSSSFAASPWYRTFDVPLESFQSPFLLPILLSPPSPTQQSLLFAPPEPEDVPLPDSPEDERHLLGLPESDSDEDGIRDLPLHLFEETRLRVLHQETMLAEHQARMNEATITEYIRRLNEMKPPREHASMSPVYFNAPLDGAKRTEVPPANAGPGPGPATLQFLQTRRKDVQHLIALRAVERRKRKRAKERGRELEALLQLKSAQLRADALRNRSRLRLISQSHATATKDDEAVVLAASGSDCHQAHTKNAPAGGEKQEGGEGARKVKQEEILQLVAKMIFRRRDSPRPLTGKPLSPLRPYRRSSLSQEGDIENATLKNNSLS